EVIVELWVPAVILLVVLTLILGVKRIWTVLALVAVGLFAIAVYRRLATTPDETAETAPATLTPAAAIESLPPDQATVRDLTITGSNAPWDFRGTILNRSGNYILLSATIRIARRDCYEGAMDPSGCVVLWEGSKRVNLQTPPDQQQQFVESISPRGSVPRAQGQVKDEFQLVGLTGKKSNEEQ
ncbi:MAG: hypothetical protein ABW110_05130, partial [Steroidobacteraceae bacterium]